MNSILEQSLQEVLAQLPWLERSCLLLSINTDFTQEEIADILNITKEEVDIVTIHAHKMLKQIKENEMLSENSNTFTKCYDGYDKDELFIRLYDTHKERLRRYMVTIGVLENLDDIIQEAYLRLYDRMSNFSRPLEREKLVSYLYTIARNIVYDKHRQDRRIGHIQIESNDTLLQNIPDKAASPEEVYEEKEMLGELNQAIEKLPEKVAEAVKGLLEGKAFDMKPGIRMPALKYRLYKAKNLSDYDTQEIG